MLFGGKALLYIVLLILLACNGDDPLVLENKRRIECESRSPICDNRDGMRFFKSVPRFEMQADSSMTVTDVWSSFIVCCEIFQQLMDSLSLYNSLLDEARRTGAPFRRSGSIGSVRVSAGVEYTSMINGKRWEWLSFGDEEFTWSMPTGEFFQAHKEELEEAYQRCCL